MSSGGLREVMCRGLREVIAIGLGGIKDVREYDPTEPGQSLGQPKMAVPYDTWLTQGPLKKCHR